MRVEEKTSNFRKSARCGDEDPSPPTHFPFGLFFSKFWTDQQDCRGHASRGTAPSLREFAAGKDPGIPKQANWCKWAFGIAVIGQLIGAVAFEEADGTFVLEVGGVGYELVAPIGTLGRAARVAPANE